MYKNLITLALLGLLYSSCNTDKKQVPTTSESGAPVEKPESRAAMKDHSHMNTSGLQWLELTEAINSETAGSKMMLLDIYTPWCGYCKLMDKKTFSDKATQKLLSENFELVKFDAESQDSIEFNGKKYGWRPNGKKGIHELAAELMDGKISYPTLIFLDKDLQTVRISRGYKNPAELTQEAEMALRS